MFKEDKSIHNKICNKIFLYRQEQAREKVNPNILEERAPLLSIGLYIRYIYSFK